MSETDNGFEENASAAQLVTIARFLEPVNAQMAKGVLESAGISSFLQGENANSMMAFAFRARLQVPRRDEAAARELLSAVSEDWVYDPAEDAAAGESF